MLAHGSLYSAENLMPTPTSTPPPGLRKRSRSPTSDSSGSSGSRSGKSKRRLLDSFTRLTIDNQRDAGYTPTPPGKKKQEPILHYDYWDMSKPPTPSTSTDDLAERMDTSNAHTVFISSLSTSSSSDDDDDGLDSGALNGGGRYVLAPDVERKIRQLPYSLLRRKAAESGWAGPVPAQVPLKEQETGMVLYRPKEQVIAESMAKHVNTKQTRKDRRLQQQQAIDPDEMADWGDDEREDGEDADDDGAGGLIGEENDLMEI
ncbi:hypothetical protein BZA70DRAFT_275412, partial [Myxozyma melibiosi]